MEQKRKVNRDAKNIRVVTKNKFIQSKGIENASVKALKLLYIAIAQCKKSDEEFYEYNLTVPEFAAMMSIDPSNLYQEIDAITDELMQAFIKVTDENSTKRVKPVEKYSVFSVCRYGESEITFKLNKDMTSFLLGITGDFTKPLLDDFLRMNSVYSIRIWHLLQQKMKSEKPVFAIEGQEQEYYVTLKELREVTGTQNKFQKIYHFKTKVLDKALREIEQCAGVKLIYVNKKSGKTIKGFYFKVVPAYTISAEKAQQLDAYIEEKKRMTREAEQIPGQQSLDIYEWFSGRLRKE